MLSKRIFFKVLKMGVWVFKGFQCFFTDWGILDKQFMQSSFIGQFVHPEGGGDGVKGVGRYFSPHLYIDSYIPTFSLLRLSVPPRRKLPPRPQLTNPLSPHPQPPRLPHLLPPPHKIRKNFLFFSKNKFFINALAQMY